MNQVCKITDAQRVASLRQLEARCKAAEADLLACKEATKCAKEAFDVSVQELRQAINDEELPLFRDEDDDAANA